MHVSSMPSTKMYYSRTPLGRTLEIFDKNVRQWGGVLAKGVLMEAFKKLL